MPLETVITKPLEIGTVSERAWLWFLALVCLIILCSNLGTSSLFEPDEGRNAEKAREILVLNDWVTPHENFLPILDKPIGLYWLIAISYKLFGISEGSARLPSALAALACSFIVYRFARQHWRLRDALWSCLILVSSFEFFIFARMVIFDMALTFCTTLALLNFYRLVRADPVQSNRASAFLMYVAMAVGTLIKGPIAVVIPGMVIFFYLLLTGKWSALMRLHLALGALIFFAIVTPWYVLVDLKNPGYLRYFLWEEHVIRYVTPHFGRTKSWYYFFAVVSVGLLPWTLLLPVVIRHFWKGARKEENLFLLLWVVVPFIFFSLSNAKLPHYILPIFPALALLTGRTLAAQLQSPSQSRLLLLSSVWIVPIGFFSYFLLGAIWPRILASPIRSATIQSMPLIAGCATLFVFIFAVFLVGQRRRLWKDWGAAYVCTSMGLAILLNSLTHVVAAGSFRRVSKPLAQKIAPVFDSGARLVFYNSYLEGLPFYLRIDQPVWLVQSREKDDVMGSFYLGEQRPRLWSRQEPVLYTFEEFAQQWNRPGLLLWVVITEKNLSGLTRMIRATPRVVGREQTYVLVTNR